MFRQRVIQRGAAVLVAVVLLAAPAAAGVAADPWAALALARPATRVGAPLFTLSALEGRPVDLGGLRGRVVLLYFWATWCPYCTRELPSINALARDLEKDGLTVLLLNIGEDRQTVQQAVKSRGYSAPVVLDVDGLVARAYGVRATPTVFLVGGDGMVRAQAIGPRPWTAPEGLAVLRSLLAVPLGAE